MSLYGEYTITSLEEDHEKGCFVGTAIFPDKTEGKIIIDFSEFFKYDPVSQEMVQLTVDNKGIRWDDIGNSDII